MQYRFRLILTLCAPVALAACASDRDDYPSLAKRPAERLTATFGAPDATSTPEPLPSPDQAVLGQLDSLVAQARRGDERFRKGEPTARRLVSKAGRAAVGSEPWSLATMAVSELEAARGQTMVPLAELDRMFAEAVTAGQDVTAINQARDIVIAILARQDQVLGELRGVLGD